MKKILFIILCIYSTNTLTAQNGVSNDSEKKFTLRLSNGITFPLSDFKSTEDSGSGYAKNGYNGAVDISYKLANNFGIGIILNYNTQATDASKKAEKSLNSNPSYNSVSIKSGSHSLLSFLIAPEYSVSLNNKFYIQGQLGFGIVNFQRAKEYITVASSSPYREIRSSGSQNSFAYQGKVSLNYNINKTFGLGVYSSYFATNSEFIIQGIDTEQKIDIISTGIQLMYNF